MLTVEEKEAIAKQRKSQSIPWIANPFTKHEHSGHHGHGAPTHSPPGGLTEGKGHTASGALETQEGTDARLKFEEALEIEEATPIELFYDLFFVANLTTVTSVHYITEWRTLSSYILFFIILWFTWLHVTLLDVRFSVDSVYERVCKGLHFAVMAAFSSVSTTWDPFHPKDIGTVNALKTMTLALMFSRFVLAVQYFVVLSYGRSKPKTVVPLAIHGTVMLTSAAVYLGLFFSFGKSKTYIAWYVMAIFEIVAVIATSSIWSSVSFKQTHLIERMGLLTLIILGEGIIVMLKAINSIVKGYGWSKTMVGVVIAALLLIYFFWMLYFDYTPKNVHYGRFRQQLWALLHFPFHLSIVLCVEGLRQLATMFNFNLLANWLLSDLSSPILFESGTPDALMLEFNETFTLLYDYSKTITADYPEIKSEILQLGEGFQSALDGLDSPFYANYESLLSKVFVGLGDLYGIKASYKKTGDKEADFTEQINGMSRLFDLVFQYYFIALSVIFLIYGVFAIIVRRQMDIFDWIAVGLRFALSAVCLCMVALPYSEDRYLNYMASPWPIPHVCLMVFFVLAGDKILGHYALRRDRKTAA